MELVDNLDGFPDVEGERTERRVDIDLSLLRNLILGDLVEVSERLMHESGHVGGFLEDLGVWAIVDELEKLVEDLLDVLNLLEVCGDEGHLGD